MAKRKVYTVTHGGVLIAFKANLRFMHKFWRWQLDTNVFPFEWITSTSGGDEGLYTEENASRLLHWLDDNGYESSKSRPSSRRRL